MIESLSKLNKLIFLASSLALLVSPKANSQSIVYDSVNKQKVVLVDVRKTYERLINKGYSSVEMYEYLATYYYNAKDFQKSKMYFDILFKKYKLSQISPNSIEIYKTLSN